MRYDIVMSDNGGLTFKDGDFAVGSSAQQEVMHLVGFVKGEIREFPLFGFGLVNYLKKRAGNGPVVESMTKFRRDLKIQLVADGFTEHEIDVASDLSTFEINVEP